MKSLEVTRRIPEGLKSCRGEERYRGLVSMAGFLVVPKAGETGFGVVNFFDRIVTSRSDFPVAAQL